MNIAFANQKEGAGKTALTAKQKRDRQRTLVRDDVASTVKADDVKLFFASLFLCGSVSLRETFSCPARKDSLISV